MVIVTKGSAAGGGVIHDPVLGEAVVNEIPSGSIDGTNVIFTLAYAPLAGTVMLFYNGLHLRPGISNDYTISGQTITMNYVIGTCPTDSLSAWYLKDGSSLKVWTPYIVTSAFSATVWDELYCDTTAIGAFAVTMPPGPSLGDSVRFVDMNNSFETNNMIIDRNGENIMGLAENLIVDINRSFDLRYSNTTEGWCIY